MCPIGSERQQHGKHPLDPAEGSDDSYPFE